MTSTVDWLRRMRNAHLSAQQAEAIASGFEDRYITRDYLDARLASLLNDITWRLIGLAAFVIVVVGLIDKVVRP
jgi:hypothetical protein